MSQKGSLTRNIFDQKFFHPLVVVARELGAARPGPAEHRGTVGIRPNPSLNTQSCINTSYLADSYIGFTLKMESVSKNTIFGLKMIVKSGLEKFILKSLHAGR